MTDLNKLVKFIPVSDPECFEDYDNMEGLNSCLYVDGGIIVINDDYDSYVKDVAEFEKNQ